MYNIAKHKGAVLGVILTPLLMIAVASGREATPIPEPTPTSAKKVMVTTTLTQATTPQPLPPPPAKNPGTLIVANTGDPVSLDPAWQYDTASVSVVFNVYEPLLFFKREKIDEFVPLLSTGWETSQDGLTYRFTIRKGVRFHQGGALEPHDVAHTFWRGMLQDRAGGSQWARLEPLLGVFGIKELAMQIAGVEDFSQVDAASLVQTCERVKQAVTFDDAAGTVTFNLAKPFGPFLQILASHWGSGSILDQEWLIEQGDWDADCATWTKWHDPPAEQSAIFSKMNGTGPFKFERWAAGEEWSIVRNQDYWLTQPLWEGGPSGPPALERVVAKIVPEWGTRLAMFKAGDADWIFVPRQFVAQMDPLVKEQYEGGERDQDRLTIVNPEGIARVFKSLPVAGSMDAFFTFQVNTEGGNPFVGSGTLDGLGIPPDFFSDVYVRQAFCHAFDYQTFIKDVWLGEAIQRTGPIISGHIGYRPDQPLCPFDLKKAEEEFKLAWEGKLWDTGFFLILTYDTGNDERKVAAEILEHNVEALNPNFRIAIQDIPGPTYLQQMTDTRLPLFFLGWQEDYHHPHNWVIPYIHSTGAFASWQAFPGELQEEFDTLVEHCVSLVGEEATKCYEGLQTKAQEAVIDLFLVQPLGRHYEQLWVNGWYSNPAYPAAWYYPLSK